ncbi:hypothetical protein QUF44_13050 [Bacillus subtilis]|nr:hypothetical protein [Bacillus subtilis]MDM5302503.1 hypothetical protein [Bacillus subtilis]MDM5324556.1 hypothetical protein [Bacillus subtilis]
MKKMQLATSFVNMYWTKTTPRGKKFSKNGVSHLFFKTRTNFFPKYLASENQLIIHKNHVLQKVKMNQNTYELLLGILSYFNNGAILNLNDKDADYKKLIKFSITNDLIYQPPSEKEKLSSLIYDYIENAFDDFQPVLHYVSSTNFMIDEAPKFVTDFFGKHLLLNNLKSENQTQVIKWIEKYDDIPQVQPGDLCILNKGNNYALFIYNENQDILQANSLLKNKNYSSNAHILGKEILPMKIFIKLVRYATNQEEARKITLLDESGLTETVSKNKINDTLQHYERTYLSADRELLEYIKEIESKYSQFYPLKIKINNEDGLYPVKLNISSYEISVNHDFSYLVFDFNYKQAAFYALTHVLEKYLNSFDSQKGVWLAETTMERFYIKGLASVLPVEDNFYQLSEVPDDIQQKISFIKGLSPNITEIKIVVQDIFQTDVFFLYLLDQDQRVLFKSDISIDLKEEVLRGLASVTALLINKIDVVEEYVVKSMKLRPFRLREHSTTKIYNNILEITQSHNISETTWVYQAEFEPLGLYIGKFFRNGDR